MSLAQQQETTELIETLSQRIASLESAAASNDASMVWIIVSAVLVFFMQAGFAMLEGGAIRSKNTVNVIMKNYMDMCFGVLIFWVFGFALMFGDSFHGFLGTSGFFFGGSGRPGLSEKLGVDHPYAFFAFQAMFAATAATIVSGAVAERIRYWPYILGSVMICGVIYPVFGSWVWGGYLSDDGQAGWLSEKGFIDFAGSTVVHSVGGWCALAAILVLKPRLGRYDPDTGESRMIPGHNLPMFALGGFILFFGWFGFNAGSQLAADSEIGRIAANTLLAGCAGGVGALLYMSVTKQNILISHTINGVLGGLVSVTAGCAVMPLFAAVIVGLIAGALVILGANLLDKLRIDDVVGAVPVHGFCGTWGTLAIGFFHQDVLSGELAMGQQLFSQFLGVIAAILWTFPLSIMIFSTINQLVKLRADTVQEQRGLDFAEHYEIGYPEFQTAQLHKSKS